MSEEDGVDADISARDTIARGFCNFTDGSGEEAVLTGHSDSGGRVKVHRRGEILTQLCFIAVAVLMLGITGVCQAQVRPDAEQIGAALTNYGNKWLADHGQAGHTVHWRTDTDPQQARWEGDVYVCRFEGAVIPTAAGATQGSYFSGELRVYVDPNDGALRCEAPGAMQFGLPVAIGELRARFPESTAGTGGGGWTQLLHLKLDSQQRPYDPENSLGPIQSGTFAVPGPGELRITYSYRVHDYAPLGGLDWDLGRGPTRYLPGNDGRSVRTPPVDPPLGGNVTLVHDQRRCDYMPMVSASLTPRGIPAGFANAIYGTQLADYQELTVEFCPDAGASAPPTGPGTVPETPVTPPVTPTPQTPPQTPETPGGPSGPPTTGTFAEGKFVLDEAGALSEFETLDLDLVLQVMRETEGLQLAVVLAGQMGSQDEAVAAAGRHRDALVAAGVLPACSGLLLYANGGELRAYNRSTDFDLIVPLELVARAWHEVVDLPWPGRVASQLRVIFMELAAE